MRMTMLIAGCTVCTFCMLSGFDAGPWFGLLLLELAVHPPACSSPDG